MNNILESSNYKLEKIDETHIIDDINLLLKQYEILLKSSNSNNQEIINGSLICEYMINLFLQKNGFLVKKDASLKEIVEFSKENKIIPNPCCSFLNNLELYKKNQGIEYSDTLRNSFLKAFAYYITWFNKSYPNNLFNINNCLNIINSKSDCKLFPLDDIIEKNVIQDDEETKSDVENIMICPSCGSKIDNDSNFCPNCRYEILKKNKSKTKENNILIEKISTNLILNILDEQNILIKTILKTIVEDENIDKKLNIISNNIHKLQSHSEKLIKIAESEEEIGRIVEVHTTECVETIFKYKKEISQGPNFKQEETNLIELFSHETWAKLSDDSKTCLITAKFLYNKYITSEEIIDYSGVCILISKALEIEIFNRFFNDFIEFLDKNYNKDYNQYPTSLLYESTIPLRPECFTMRNISFILCKKENWTDTEEQIRNNKEKLLEYCRECIFSNKSTKQIEKLLDRYASSIDMIQIKFVNPSTHKNNIDRKTAKDCFDLLIDNQKLLKKILDSFDK